MSTKMWPEVQQAKSDNKRELKLSGADISERIDKIGLNMDIFALDALNLLNISDTTLEILPAELSNLNNLQTLLLYGNNIKNLPESIGKLDKLKVLDVSRNQLESVPDTIVELKGLTTINMSYNQLDGFPVLKDYTKLSVINLSGNKLTAVPEIYSEENVNLSEIYLEENAIELIPHEIKNLAALKHLSLAKNQIKKIPKSLAAISKLKDLDLSGNPVADKRLLKLIQQCRTKQVLDYVKQHGEDAPASDGSGVNGSAKSKKSSKGNKKTTSESDVPKHKIFVKRHNDDTVKIVYDDMVKDIRSYILCCIVDNVNLSGDRFRKFLQLQTKLHDTVCGKREKSTIATHDLKKLPSNDKNFILYTAKEPAHLKIHPLGKFKKVSAQRLYNDLKAEADALRKEKKRNVYSGIHKYLYLLENKPLFSCVEDGLGNVISLPPLTNGDLTKISPETTTILVEVTSSTSMPDCSQTIDDLLKLMLVEGFGTEESASDENIRNTLHVQQCKIVDIDGNLRRVYPAKTDLIFEDTDNIVVDRE